MLVVGCFHSGNFFSKTLSLLFPDQEQRVKSVMIGRLSPGDSFGEITVLKGFLMPCSVVTDTPVQMGTISTLDVHGTYFDTLLFLVGDSGLFFFIFFLFCPTPVTSV